MRTKLTAVFLLIAMVCNSCMAHVAGNPCRDPVTGRYTSCGSGSGSSDPNAGWYILGALAGLAVVGGIAGAVAYNVNHPQPSTLQGNSQIDNRTQATNSDLYCWAQRIEGRLVCQYSLSDCGVTLQNNRSLSADGAVCAQYPSVSCTFNGEQALCYALRADCVAANSISDCQRYTSANFPTSARVPIQLQPTTSNPQP
ncbi:MAG: hypothetical protein E6R04_01230 [Spirochaetes bacterium]|nr:MAG: hypothetical protein E6R04_01230 [Spirochaetota bacterium]